MKIKHMTQKTKLLALVGVLLAFAIPTYGVVARVGAIPATSTPCTMENYNKIRSNNGAHCVTFDANKPCDPGTNNCYVAETDLNLESLKGSNKVQLTDTKCSDQAYATDKAKECATKEGTACDGGELCYITQKAMDAIKAARTASANSTKSSETASGATNYYIDNAGGKQSMRIKKAKGDKRPAIVFVHGGGWAVDGGTFDPAFQDAAAKQGFTSFRIKYRLMPGGVHEQLQDVLRAVRHVKANAAAYNIDPNKIAIWGDSAGGSLTVRAAATGKSGASAAVGWSAPTNAFRDLFNSWKGFADGMFHSRCVGEYFPPFTMDVINFFVGNQASLNKLASGKALSPQESSALLNKSLQLSGIVLTDLPATFGKLDKAANDFGVTYNGKDTDTKAEAPLSQDELEKKLANLNPEQLMELGTAIYEFKRMADSGALGSDDSTLNTISVISQGLGNIISAQDTVAQTKTNSGNNTIVSDASMSGGALTDVGKSLITGGDISSIGINPQQISASKIAQCMDDFVQLSPALTASPRTPPMHLVTYAHDELVNIQDAYQMRDKLRSMGIRSEVYVMKHNKSVGHLGYHPEAKAPSFRFLKSALKVK